jgi:hypothetical protein
MRSACIVAFIMPVIGRNAWERVGVQILMLTDDLRPAPRDCWTAPTVLTSEHHRADGSSDGAKHNFRRQSF